MTLLENPTVTVIQHGLIEHEAASDPHPQYATLAESRDVFHLSAYGDPAGVTLMPAGAISQALTDAAYRTLYIDGRFRIGASSATECILQTRPCRVIGDGLGQSVIEVDPGVGATVDVWRIVPAVSGQDLFGWEYAGFRLKAASGAPARHGIVLDLPDDATKFVARRSMRRLWVGPFGARALSEYKAGTVGAGFNGVFTSVIEGCRFDGGAGADRVVSLDRSGDSVVLRENTITGTGIGVYTAPVSGAARQTIADNNITASGGGIYVMGGEQVAIIRNQIEQSAAYTGNPADLAAIVIDGAKGCLIADNNINGYDRVHGVYLKGTAGRNQIHGNEITVDTAGGKYHFVLGASTVALNDLGLGRNHYYSTGGALASQPAISDLSPASVAPIGVAKKLTLAGGWADGPDTNFEQGLYVTLMPDGTVRLLGTVAGGTTTAGTTIATLPVWCRPLGDARTLIVQTVSAGVANVGFVNVDTSGNVNVLQLPASTTWIRFDGVTFHTYGVA